MTWEINASEGGKIVRRLTLTNDNGSNIDTTGWTWKAAVRGLPVSVNQISPGVIEVVITSAQTNLIGHGVYSLGIDWLDAQGNAPEQEVKAVVRIERSAAP